jgi:hypothetical protein
MFPWRGSDWWTRINYWKMYLVLFKTEGCKALKRTPIFKYASIIKMKVRKLLIYRPEFSGKDQGVFLS